MPLTQQAIQDAAQLIRTADALFVGAGAGASADSGIPVYYGPGGRYGDNTNKDGYTGIQDASAALYETDPTRAQQATRSRHQALLNAQPHPGHHILNNWRLRAASGAAVYTSNIDSMFQRAGFPHHAVYEVHGAHARSQCLTLCTTNVFPTSHPTTATTCPNCGGPTRPNILMFGDFTFLDTHRTQQWDNLANWFDQLSRTARVVILEIGAGHDVPTVHNKCVALAHAEQWPLIRINPTPANLPTGRPGVNVPLGAAEALTRIDAALHVGSPAYV